MSTLLSIVLAAVLWVIVRRLWDFHKALQSIDHYPGDRLLFNPFQAFTFITRVPIPWISSGKNHLFVRKYDYYAKNGYDMISSITMLPQINRGMLIADADVIKEVVTHRAKFPKPVQYYGILSIYGRNIVASEGEEWKKFRKVSAPSFSERNNRLVWNETIRVMTELFEQVWGSKDQIQVDHVLDITFPITLFVISAAGFGRPISWQEESTRPAGYQMTFKEALQHVSENVQYKLVIPDFILQLGLTQRLRDIKVAFPELERYMLDMIHERRTVKDSERHDLFSGLLEANEKDYDGHARLTDSELMGNIFIFLLAGHETTAHSLAFALGLLALHPDIQEELYQSIQSVRNEKGSLEYEDLNAYSYTVAVFLETLRMFPSVTGIPKGCEEDTVFHTMNASGARVPIMVRKGVGLALDAPGLHYNPRYWEDPYTFNPSRFLENWPRNAYIPFSAGPRACLGRKFSETEAVVVLNMFVSRYKIQVKEEPQFSSETWEQKKTRVLNTDIAITLTPTRIPLTFVKRT